MPYLKTQSGINWHFQSAGQGEAVVFLHGWGVDSRVWRQQTKHFSPKYRVVSVDLPGHGESGFIKIDLSSMAKDLLEILDYLKINQFHFVGSSLGGLFGLKMYALNPRAFKRVVFVGSIPKFAKSEGYPFGLDVAQMRKLNGQLNTAYPSIVNIFFRSLFTKEERESRRFRWLQKFRETDVVPIKQALAEYLDVLEKEDLREVFKKIHVPVHIINGRDDPICNAQAVICMMTLKSGIEVEWFDGCGHFPFLSKPREFNDALEKFLNKSK